MAIPSAQFGSLEVTAGARTARLLLVFSGLRMVLFPIPIITLYWKDHIGLSLADIMTLQAAFAVAAVVCEFPSGYIADRIGRRTALLVGAVVWIAGWSVYGGTDTFAGVLVAETLLGAGMAFTSGADSALLFTALEASEGVGNYPRWESRTRAAAQLAESASSAVGGVLYATQPRLPFWLQIPVAVLSLGSVLGMQEPNAGASGARTSHLREAWRIIRHTLGHQRRLRSTILLSLSLGLPTFVMVWLLQPLMQQRGIPAVWFGPIWAGMHLYLAGISLLSTRVAARLGREATLLGCCLLIALGYAALGSTTTAAAIAFYLCFMTVRGLQAPVLVSALQHDAPAADRAGVLSINALVFRLSFALIGPPIGWLVDSIGLRPTLLVLAGTFGTGALAAFAGFRRVHRLRY